jgi:hypothetical protein
MSTHQYRYRPPSGPTRFRLLHIAPGSSNSGSSNSPLLTELVETSLDQARYYFALSYVWGDTEPSNPLYIGISRLGIRQSLFDALRSFRKQGILTVWADAVYINQGDPQDCTDQVILIRRIYEASHKVIIYFREFRSDEARGLYNLFELLYTFICRCASNQGIPPEENLE